MSFVILALLLAGVIALVAYPLRGGAASVPAAVRAVRPARGQRACPQCGAGYDAGDRFCVQCGNALPLVGGTQVCSACGAPLDADDAFCAKCGTARGGRGA